MKVLHVYVQPRGGGGSVVATRTLIEASRRAGLIVEEFTGRSADLGDGLLGRVRAGVKAVAAPDSIREFRRRLDAFAPDVVHINELFPLISPRILQVCGQAGVPVVMTCDDYHLTCPARTHFRAGRTCTRCLGGNEYWAALLRCKPTLAESVVNSWYTAALRWSELIPRHVSHFTACSEFARSWLIEHAGLPGERVTTIPHAIVLPPEPADPTLGTYAAFAGRFVPEKGIPLLLEAGALCGVPIKLARNVHHPRTLGVAAHADIVTTRDHEDLARFYRAARMLVFPSLWFETQGLVGAEAMSHGIPVIGSRLGAVANLIDDGIDGLLFEPGNAVDLAAKMRRLWDEPELAAMLGQAARAKAVRLWNADGYLAAMLQVYRRVTGATPNAQRSG